jgi:hypothetical protein
VGRTEPGAPSGGDIMGGAVSDMLTRASEEDELKENAKSTGTGADGCVAERGIYIPSKKQWLVA